LSGATAPSIARQWRQRPQQGRRPGGGNEGCTCCVVAVECSAGNPTAWSDRPWDRGPVERQKDSSPPQCRTATALLTSPARFGGQLLLLQFRPPLFAVCVASTLHYGDLRVASDHANHSSWSSPRPLWRELNSPMVSSTSSLWAAAFPWYNRMSCLLSGPSSLSPTALDLLSPHCPNNR